MSNFRLVQLLGQIPLSITIDNDGILNNLAGTAAPTVNDDTGDGYSVGSKWIDTVGDEVYFCTDATLGAAVWVLVSADDHTELSNIGTNTHAQIDTHIANSAIHFSDEQAQDAVGNILTDTASVDFTYNDAGPSITATVLPAGVDHNSLNNYSANRHIDHTAVSVITGATSGLSGGGDISSSRTLLVAPNLATAVSPASGDEVLIADVSDSNNLKKVTISDIVALAPAGYTDEQAQDAIGTILTDSSSIDFTYNDGAPSITAVVLPAGVDHDSLLNYSAARHKLHPTSTDLAIAKYTGTSGDLANSGVIIDASNHVVTPNNAFYKSKNFAATTVSLIGIDAADNMYLGESSGYNIRVRGANFIPDASCNLGAPAAPWPRAAITKFDAPIEWDTNVATIRTSSGTSSFDITLNSGTASGAGLFSGSISLRSGSATGTANSGDVSIGPGGVASGTSGKLRLRLPTEGTVGHVLTSIDTTGGSAWASYASLINALSADTPVSGDKFPFYDISGGDANYVTLSGLQNALWVLAPNVAHVKADGTGSHATIVAANADASIVTIILYPGTHSVDNSAGFITLTKSIISFGGKNRATISRTTNSNVCFRVTANAVQMMGVGFSGGGASDPFFLEVQAPATFSQAIYADIQIAASMNGILVRSANGTTFEKITGFTMNTAIQVGDASSSFAPTVIIRNCGIASYGSTGITVYNCARCDIVASSIVSGTTGTAIALSILSTCTGRVNTTGVTFDGNANNVKMNGTTGSVYTSSSDTFANYASGSVISDSAAPGTVVMNGSTLSYNTPVDGNFDFVLDAATTLKGYWFDAYIGELINAGDSRSYRNTPNLRWAFMFGGNT